MRKSHWGNAQRRRCKQKNARYAFPLPARRSTEKRHVALWYAATEHCPRRPPDWLISVENLKNVTRDPLVKPDGCWWWGRAERQITRKSYAGRKAGSRSGLQSGASDERGVDAEKVIGISGHLLAPEVLLLLALPAQQR